ncbi:MAG: MFS transporter [Chloroflexi bacterium]|nr:MFS transporter [Chloroflexota bacterium]
MATQAEVKWALKRPRFFPGYLQAFLGALNGFIGYGAYMYSWSALVSGILRAEAKTVTRGDIAFGAALGRLEGGLEAAPAGYMIDSWGPKYMSTLGFIVAGIGYILLGLWLVKAGWWIWLCYGFLIQLSMNWALYTCSNKIIAWYFIKRRGMWMALHTMGAAFGGMIMTPLAAAVITATSWNTAAIATGVFCFLGAVVAFIGYRNRPPQAYGLLPDNDKLPHERTKEELEAAKAKGATKVMTADDFLPDMTIWDGVKTRAFWALAWQGAFAGLYAFTFPTFLTDHFRSLGFSLQESANYMALYFPMTLLGRLAVAGLSDRFNPQIFSALASFGIGVGILFTAYATKERAWMLLAYAPLYGIPMGMSPAVGQHLSTTWFGRKWMITIPGLRSLVDTPLVFLGTLAVGLIADASGGSYVTAFTWLGISTSIGGIGLWVIGKQPKVIAEARRKAREFGIHMQG